MHEEKNIPNAMKKFYFNICIIYKSIKTFYLGTNGQDTQCNEEETG